mmetsp:Transcript_55114/g.120593  ORF Transcript_55114/g.120593 Transcript_55114/m.120593 type:complete len:753 (+) Transcript_55114:52-2310(+)
MAAASSDAVELLSKHQDFRKRWPRTWAPTSIKDKSGSSLARQIEHCACLSSAIYCEDTSQFEAQVAASTLLKVHPGTKSLPSCDNLVYIEKAEVPVGSRPGVKSLCSLGVVTLVTRPLQGKLRRELYFVYKGSNETMDWLSNLDFGPVPTSAKGVQVMCGVHGMWHCSQQTVLTSIKQALARGDLSGVYFTGHSRGAGAAFLAHLECWHRFPKLQGKTFCLGFSSPPVFYVDKGVVANMAGFSDFTINMFAEHDLVPHIHTPGFCIEALKSTAMSGAPEWLANFIRQPFNNAWAKYIEGRWNRKLQDDHLRHLEHLSTLCVAAANFGDPENGELWQQAWSWTVYKSSEAKIAFFRRPWPFSGLGTMISIQDHTWMAKGIGPTWQTDHCHRDCDLMGLDGEETSPCKYCMENGSGQNFYDCRACRLTWCRRCAYDPQQHRCGKEWVLERTEPVTNRFLASLEVLAVNRMMQFAADVARKLVAARQNEQREVESSPRIIRIVTAVVGKFVQSTSSSKDKKMKLTKKKIPYSTEVQRIAQSLGVSLSPTAARDIVMTIKLVQDSKILDVLQKKGALDRTSVVDDVASAISHVMDLVNGRLSSKAAGMISRLAKRALGEDLSSIVGPEVGKWSVQAVEQFVLTHVCSAIVHKEQLGSEQGSRIHRCERVLVAMRVLALSGAAIENLEKSKVRTHFEALVSTTPQQEENSQQRHHRIAALTWSRQVLMDFLNNLKKPEGQEDLHHLLNLLRPPRAKL